MCSYLTSVSFFDTVCQFLGTYFYDGMNLFCVVLAD